jgi:hypothetical protein
MIYPVLGGVMGVAALLTAVLVIAARRRTPQ